MHKWGTYNIQDTDTCTSEAQITSKEETPVLVDTVNISGTKTCTSEELITSQAQTPAQVGHREHPRNRNLHKLGTDNIPDTET